jgi:hypothetical protein
MLDSDKGTARVTAAGKRRARGMPNHVIDDFEMFLRVNRRFGGAVHRLLEAPEKRRKACCDDRIEPGASIEIPSTRSYRWWSRASGKPTAKFEKPPGTRKRTISERADGEPPGRSGHGIGEWSPEAHRGTP